MNRRALFRGAFAAAAAVVLAPLAAIVPDPVRRLGFSWPKGVVVYDALHDFMDDGDYWLTDGLVNSTFRITYPEGMFNRFTAIRVRVGDDTLFDEVRA